MHISVVTINCKKMNKICFNISVKKKSNLSYQKLQTKPDAR